MTNQELFELMDRFSASGLTGLRLTQKDVSLELTWNGAAPAAPAPACARRGRNRRGRSCPHRWWGPITPPLRRTPPPS